MDGGNMIARDTLAFVCVLAVTVTACSAMNSASCNSTRAASSQSRETTTDLRNLPYPTDTRLVARLRPDQLADAMQPSDRESSVPPTRAARVVVDRLVQGRWSPFTFGEWTAAFTEAARSDDSPTLSHIDPDRPMVLAVSTRHNESVLRDLDHSLPPVRASQLPAGLSMRAFLPADGNATSLRSEFERMCGTELRNCPSVVRTKAHDSWLVFDLHEAPSADLPAETLPDTWDGTDSHVFPRRTPAVKRFLSRDTAASVYWRTEDLAAVGAVAGAVESVEDLSRLEKQWPGSFLAEESLHNSISLHLDDPAARQYEDATLQLRSPSPGERSYEMVATRTEHGNTVAEHAAPELTLPGIQGDELPFRLEYAYDASAATKVANTPGPVEGVESQKDLTMLFEALRTKPGAMPTALGSSPAGLVAAIGPSWSDYLPGHVNSALQAWRNVHAVRGAADFETSASDSAGPAPTGVLAMLVDADSRVPDYVDRAATMLDESLGLEVEIDRQPRQDTDRVLVTAVVGDPAVSLGEESRIEPGLRGHMDARETTLPRPLEESAFGRLLSSAGTMSFETASSDGATGMRFQTGVDAPGKFTVPETDVSPTSHDGKTSCRRRLAATSRDALSNSTMNYHEVVSTADGLLKELETAKQECPDASRTIRRRWLEQRAVFEARVGDFVYANFSAAEACKLADDESCPMKQRLGVVTDNFRAPMSLPHSRFGWPDKALFYVGRDEVFYPRVAELSPSPRLERDVPTDELADALDDPDSATHRRLMDRLPLLTIPEGADSSATLGVLTVDQSIGSDLFRALVEMADRKQLDRETREAEKLIGRSPPGESVSGVVLYVRSRARDDGALPALILRTDSGEPPEGAEPVELELGRDGVSVEMPGGKRVEGPDGCAADEPTFCVRDSEKTAELLDRLDADPPADRGVEELDTPLVRQFRTDQLAAVLREMANHDRRYYFELSFRDDVPVAIVAAVVGTTGVYAREKDGREAVPHVRFAD
jgi:hypothetical protein